MISVTTSTGLPIKEGRLVLPLRHRLLGGVHQQRMAADQLQILDGAVLADDGGELHRALNAGLLGERRIHRLNFPDQVGFGHVAADAHAGRSALWLWAEAAVGARRERRP